MPPRNLIPYDTQTPFIDVSPKGTTEGYGSFYLLERFRERDARLQAAAYLIATAIALENQSASIGATPIPTRDPLPRGLYRVSWYARVTTVDAVSSSLAITFGWTESSQALTLSGAAITGNLTTSVQSGQVALMQVDQGGPVTYSTVYASNTPGQMKYRLSIVLEAVA